MRSLNLILASTLLLIPVLSACSDDADGTSESENDSSTAGESDTETSAEGGSASAEGDGDGDPTGDGDGDPTGDGDGDPPGDGDGDGDPTGDGDGDPTGDGDGDATGDGDGDGDGACMPFDDSECQLCLAENCCEELTACAGDDDCNCFNTCLNEGNGGMQCTEMCGIDNPMQIPGFGDLRSCTMDSCGDFCEMGGGGNGG